jgi:DNA-binding transcriptional MerR regulator
MTIGELARRAGIPASRIRYYEAVGVLTPPLRASGARAYDESAVAAVARVVTARRLGVSLADLCAAARGATTFAEVAANRLAAVEADLRRARVVRALLRHAIAAPVMPTARYDRLLARIARSG